MPWVLSMQAPSGELQSVVFHDPPLLTPDVEKLALMAIVGWPSGLPRLNGEYTSDAWTSPFASLRRGVRSVTGSRNDCPPTAWRQSA